MLLLAALVAPRGAAHADPAIAFLISAFGVSAAEAGRLERGEVVARTLDAPDRREVATLGIVRITASPETYVQRLSDIATFKRTGDVQQIGTFSDVPRMSDVAGLTIDEPDLKALRTCRVDDCGVRLPATAIERFQREIDWRAPDASDHATRLLRQVLVDYVARYRQSGAAAEMEYADRAPRLNVGRAFASLLQTDTLLSRYAPGLRHHLLHYPRSSADRSSDFVYWSKELVHRRWVISVTHVAIARANGESPIAYAIGSKQIYAMHYFDASLGLTFLVPDRAARVPTTYLVYLNRSRIDLFEGLFGGFLQRIVAVKARTMVADQLQRLQQAFAARSAQEWDQ